MLFVDCFFRENCGSSLIIQSYFKKPRTVYAHIAASKINPTTGEHEQVLWWGPGRGAATLFVPMRIKDATASAPALKTGSMLKVEPKALWWTVNAVANWADLR